MKPYRKDEKRGLLPFRFNEERALWRDSASLFELDGAHAYAPRAFAWLAALAEEGCLDQSMWATVALGMANDQAKVEFYRTERLPLPVTYLRNQQLLNTLRDDVLGLAEAVARQLWGAARSMALFTLAPAADSESAHQPAPDDLQRVMAPWGIERRYWSRLELPFRVALEQLPQNREAALTEWRKALRRIAWDAFETAAEDVETDARHLKAAVEGQGQLAAGLAKLGF